MLYESKYKDEFNDLHICTSSETKEFRTIYTQYDHAGQ